MVEDPGPGRTTHRVSGARAWLSVFLKGVAMGAADTVPGVSGGTIALITGIYERLVTGIAAIDHRLVLQTIGASRSSDRLPVRAAARRIDLPFLLVLGLGIATAILTVSGVLALTLERYRAPTNAFFFGLIAASAVVLYGEVKLDTPRRWTTAVLAAAFAFWLTGATAAGAVPHALPVVLIAGTVTSSALLLPGISGAALLYILGQYEYMIGALHGFIGSLAGVMSGDELTAAVADGTVVLTFLAGVGMGLVTIAHVVRWAFRYDRATTLTALVSLMVGALRLPAEEILADTSTWTATSAGGVLVAGLIGAGLVLVLDRYTDDLDYTV
jgi:putative membrane protein